MGSWVLLNYWDVYLTKNFQTVCQIFHWIKESQKDRLEQPLRSSAKPPYSSRTPAQAQPVAWDLSRWSFTLFKDGDSTLPLGNLCQILVPLTVHKCFLTFRKGPPVFHFKPIISDLLHGDHWKDPDSSFFIPSHQVFVHISKIPLSLSRLNHSSLSLSWCVRCSSLKSLWPPSGLHSACPCLSRAEKLRIGNSAPGVDWPVLEKEGSPLCSCWQFFA